MLSMNKKTNYTLVYPPLHHWLVDYKKYIPDLGLNKFSITSSGAWSLVTLTNPATSQQDPHVG